MMQPLAGGVAPLSENLKHQLEHLSSQAQFPNIDKHNS
jgi:hypothetical protein